MARPKKSEKILKLQNKRGTILNKSQRYQELMKCGLDPKYFIKKYIKISHPIKGLVKFDLFPFQEDCLDAFVNHKKIIVNKSRQLGLSTVSAAYSLWMALFHRERNILVIATKMDVAQNFIKKVNANLEGLPDWLVQPQVVGQSKKHLQFSNGSQIKAVPTSAESTRSESLSVLIVDEAAHIENIEELWVGLQPTLSCLAGNTKVFTNRGIYSIEDFHINKKIGEYFEIKDDIQIYGKDGLETLSHGYVSPESETLIFTTKHGYSVETTLKHPLWKLTESGGEMCQAQNLKIGDCLRIQNNMQCFGTNKLDKKEAYVLGYEIAFSDRHTDCSDDLKYETPKNIWTSDKETIIDYLSGLLEDIILLNGNNLLIDFYSKKLVQETQLLLLNLGIVSYVKPRDIIGYFLIIPSEELENYINFFNVKEINSKHYLLLKSLKQIKNIIPENFFFDPIVKIEKSFNKTYDFTVPKTHTFIQNGILGSNTGGSAILISSPYGVGSLFHKLWVSATKNKNDKGEGVNGFYPIELPWNVHPERDQKWFEQQCAEIIAANGERGVATELLCSFNASGDTFLKNDTMDHLFQNIKDPIAINIIGRDEIWIWKYPEPHKKYILCADISRGDGDDFSAFHVVDITNSEIVLDYKGKDKPDKVAEIMMQYGFMYNTALICQELNSIGVAAAIKLKDSKYPNLFYEKFMKNVYMSYITQDVGDELPGFTINPTTRPESLAKLETAIRNKNIKIYSKRLFEEFQTFIWKNNKPQAQKGYNDDAIMALAIGCNLYEPHSETNHMTTNVDDAMAMLKGMSRESKRLDPYTGNQKTYGTNNNVNPQQEINNMTADGLWKKSPESQTLQGQLELQKKLIMNQNSNTKREVQVNQWNMFKWLMDD